MTRRALVAWLALVVVAGSWAPGCGAAVGSRSTLTAIDRADAEHDVREVLDAWHDAAARSDEEAYFARMTEDAVFLGTDATERWTRDEFRAYAHRPFSEGHGWHMRAIRRDVVIAGELAWFDEDLETVNLGPSRGSGVLRRGDDGRWRIAQYNLAITVPNERFGEVRALLASGAPRTTDSVDAAHEGAHESTAPR